MVQNIFDLQICFIPVHLPEENHWVLAVVDFETSTISILDSWEPTQKANSKVWPWTKAQGANIIQVISNFTF